MKFIIIRFSVILLLTVMLSSVSYSQGKSPKDTFFHEQVAPILVKNCIECHNSSVTKGNLNLETLASALKGGDEGKAIVLGKPEESQLYLKIIEGENKKKPEMPRKKPALAKADVEKIKAWIEQGAAWPKEIVLKEKAKADGSFWSFKPINKVTPPVISDAPDAWKINPIDAFVFSKLKEKGLKPSALAQPRDFIRRATYDLIGLPPTLAETEAFVVAYKANSQQAINDLVDRLLASPRYGEHWGRHWLDVIRFGESRGYERNEIITNLWPFRDYVIKSINDDKAFDVFIREHLAGDVIGKGKPELDIASAFLVAGPYDDVGNQDAMAAAQIRSDQMDEMIRATSEAFLGLTMGCARCHDHKFDPLLAKDYYSMFSTFAGVVHGPREVASSEQRAARAEQVKGFEAKKIVLDAKLKKHNEELITRSKKLEPELAKDWKRQKASRYTTEESFDPIEAKFLKLTVESSDSLDLKALSFRIDELEVFSVEPSPRNVALASNGCKAEGESRQAKDFSGAYGAFLVNDGKFGERWIAGGKTLLLSFAKAEKINRIVFSSDRNKALPIDSPLTPFVGEYVFETSLDNKIWKTVASSKDRIPTTNALKEARLLKKVNTEKDRMEVAEINKQLAEVNAQIAKIPPLPVWWVGNRRPAPGPFNIYLGGSPQRKGEAVIPAGLSILANNPSHYSVDVAKPEGERRLAMANWITAIDNPLAPRVLANRIWHYHFGTGIVDTPSDFGFMGGRPTHPELLDWLATKLMSEGWHLKPLHKLLMTSQTYQQSSVFNPEAARIDGDTRYLWRFPPRRMQAEEIRDTILSVAGKLDLKMGGPGFRLYEYQQDNVATYVPLDVHGPDTYRRAVYHHNARAARVDILADFDIPDPAFAEPRRASTTTPLQALTLMNHRFAFDMANFFNQRVVTESNSTDPATQIKVAFNLALGRNPSEEELNRAKALVSTHGLRACCRALLNSNEMINLR